MTRSRLWRTFESGDTASLRLLRIAILASGGLFLCWTAALFLGWQQQLILAAVTVCVALLANRWSKSYVVTLALVLLSIYSTARYGIWRFKTVIETMKDPGRHWTEVDAFFIWMLLAAEFYAFVVLVLGYVQTLWPLHRRPVPLPGDPDEWPAVDVLIPTYDEPLSVVRFTALAAMNIDWPAEKLHVYLLDDGRREEFRRFAEEAGIGYLAREEHVHAKAGNLNHALKHVSSPFVAIFDCDHVPTRSFLQLTLGWFLREQRLAVLQTPQHYYSPNPYERNLDQFRTVPNEDELYYGVVQDGNDFWNAACFCGSCALLRRSALDEVGGFAVETMTEDTHTSMRMQMRGWSTGYINIPQAAGLASERLSGHVRQRVRWARGMVQILRLENPLFVRGLSAAQRLCYFNAMTHFFYALPRLIFLTAPTIYLTFGIQNLPGFWMTIVVYAAPHLVMTYMTQSRIQGKHRHSFWNEIYETVLAPYILLPTLIAFIRPRAGRFQVTAKGGVVQQGYFDSRIARPFFMLGAINLFGLICAVPRFFAFPVVAGDGWMSFLNWPASLYDPGHTGTIWVNVLWALFNLAILGVAIAVAWESRQRRQTVRVARAVPSDVILADGSMIQGITSDLSSGGVRTRSDHVVKARAGERIRFVLPVLDGSATLPATVVAVDGNELRARFDSLSLLDDEALTMILYSRADAWLGVGRLHEADRPVRSLLRILRISARGFRQGLKRKKKGKRRGDRGRAVAGNSLPLIAFAVLGLACSMKAQSMPQGSKGAADKAAHGVGAGSFHRTLTLEEMGAGSGMTLRGFKGSQTAHFFRRRNEVVQAARLKLRYRFSPGLIPGLSHLNVSLNGRLVATIADDIVDGQTGWVESDVSLPPEVLSQDNQLTFELIGHYAERCEDASSSTLWASVDAASSVELSGTLRAGANHLGQLPAPFYDSGFGSRPVVQIAFLASPSARAMQAAGVVASWLGTLYGGSAVRFAVSLGAIPAGDAIVMAENRADIPAALGLGQSRGAVLAMARNPGDAYGSLLVIAGDDSNELMTAAGALAAHADTLQGRQVVVDGFAPPAARAPDDAPRWLSTDADAGNAALDEDLHPDGSAPASMYFRLPPDLAYGERKNLGLHLSYRYNGVPLGADSTLQVYVNGVFVSATPLPHTDHASSVLDTVVPIPVVDLRPFSNTIRFQFAFHRAVAGGCVGEAPANLEGTILKDTYLDIAGIDHVTVLPNLELFANAGYPFTRRADLAETSVVIPQRPTAAELELFLGLMGHFGAQTGYPAWRIGVTDATGMKADSGRDYLVLGTANDQPAWKILGRSMPVEVGDGGLLIHDAQGKGWSRKPGEMTSGGLQTEGGLPDALIEGMEWPTGSRRSVVAIVVRDDDAVAELMSAFLNRSQTADIARTVSVLRDGRFSSYVAGGERYRVGRISMLMYVSMIFEESPWLIAVVTVIFCFLMAALIQAMLRRHARERLQGSDE